MEGSSLQDLLQLNVAQQTAASSPPPSVDRADASSGAITQLSNSSLNHSIDEVDKPPSEGAHHQSAKSSSKQSSKGGGAAVSDVMQDALATLAAPEQKRATTRLNVDLDDEQYRALKIESAMMGRSMTEIVRALVTGFLASRKEER